MYSKSVYCAGFALASALVITNTRPHAMIPMKYKAAYWERRTQKFVVRCAESVVNGGLIGYILFDQSMRKKIIDAYIKGDDLESVILNPKMQEIMCECIERNVERKIGNPNTEQARPWLCILRDVKHIIKLGGKIPEVVLKFDAERINKEDMMYELQTSNTQIKKELAGKIFHEITKQITR